MSDNEGDEREYVFTIPAMNEMVEAIKSEDQPIAKRMRTVFLLKQVGDEEAIEALTLGLYSKSVLLGHECAYALGQLQDKVAVPQLVKASQDTQLDPIVRHECVEALANIDADTPSTVELLERLCKDPCSEVSDTAIIAIEKVKRAKMELQQAMEQNAPQSKYYSVDPAPPLAIDSIDELKERLNDRSASLYDRYRAMFTLRNIGTAEAIEALASSLDGDDSPVFRHEIAYVMGQIAHPAALECLQKLLANKDEHAMVRHEAAEAIGAIAETDCEPMLRSYLETKDNIIVQESCEVALDLSEYWRSDEVSTAVEENEAEDNEPRARRGLLDDIPVTKA